MSQQNRPNAGQTLGVEASPGDRRFPCAQCGAVLAFEPGTTSLKCGYCGHLNPIAKEGQVVEHDFLDQLARMESAAPTESHDTVKCGACAAEVDRQPNVTSFSCPFCGSNIVSKEQCLTRIKAGALLPFLITNVQARESFRKWLSSRWFAPNALKTHARQDDKLAGMYTPYFTYDAMAHTRYTGARGEYYYVTVGSGKNRRTERRVRWYPAAGTVHNRFNDVLVMASTSLPRDKAEALAPWDLSKLVPYDDQYLAGFRAESYQVGLREGFAIATQLMAPIIEQTIRQDIGGDTQRIDSAHSAYDEISFKHILLPVWLSVYRYSGKLYRFLVNARTGEVQGERPYSWIKITLAVVAGLAAVTIFVLIVANNR